MAALGFPAGPLTVRKISISKDRLTISGQQRTCRLDYMGFQFHDLAVQSRFSGKNADFTLEVPLIRDSGLGILDLRAAGLDERTFEKYPGCSSGFLIVEKNSEKQHRELNDFSKQSLTCFCRKQVWYKKERILIMDFIDSIKKTKEDSFILASLPEEIQKRCSGTHD